MDPALPPADRRSFFQWISDWLFGRDFFISYRWEDGRHYAAALAARLKAARFDCFLDSDGFLKGDNWRKVGARELRKTSRLVLVGSPKVHVSEPVAHELKLFGQAGRRVIAIEFGDSLSPEKYPDSVVLPLLDRAAIREKEPPERLGEGPSESVIQELQRAFSGETAIRRRMRAIQSVLAVVAALAVAACIATGFAWNQYRTNLLRAARADAQRAATDADHGNYDSAIGFFCRSLERNPADSAVASALVRLVIEHPPVFMQALAHGPFDNAALSEDGAVLLMLSQNGEVWLSRDHHPAELIATGGRRLSQIALSPNGKLAVVAAENQIAELNPATRQLGAWQTVPHPVTALTLTDSGQLAVGDDTGSVGVGRAGLVEWRSQTTFENPVAEITFLDAPLWLAAVDQTRRQRAWNAQRQLSFECSDPDMIDLVTFGRKNIRIMATSDGGGLEGGGLLSSATIFRHDPTQESAPTDNAGPSDFNWPESASSRNHEAVTIRALSASTEGNRYLALLSSGHVEVGGENSTPLVLNQAGATAFAATPGHDAIVTAHLDGTLRRWDRKGVQVGVPIFAEKTINRLLVDSNLSHVVAFGTNDVISYDFRAVKPLETVVRNSNGPAPEPPATFKLTFDSSGAPAPVKTGRYLKPKAPEDPNGEWIVKGEKEFPAFIHSLTEEEERTIESMREHGRFAADTAAVLSDDGKVLATIAGNQSLKIWKVDDPRRIPRCELNSPFPDAYPTSLQLSKDGRQAFVTYDRSRHATFETLEGKILGKHSLLSSESIEAVWPDSAIMLVAGSGALSVQRALDGEVLAGPVAFDGEIRAARFAAGGALFWAADRSGSFRVWRSSDGMPVCAETVFDWTSAPNNGAPQDDTYQFTTWTEETGPASDRVLRRIAFRVDNDNSTGRASIADVHIFDVGAKGTPGDHRKFADLVTRLYGVRLNDLGNLRHPSPEVVSELKAFQEPNAWESDDFRAVARWLLSSRISGQPTPYARF